MISFKTNDNISVILEKISVKIVLWFEVPMPPGYLLV